MVLNLPNPVKSFRWLLRSTGDKYHDLKRISVRRILLIAVAIVSLLYFCDYLSVKYRIPKSHEPFGSVVVKTFYAVPQKNGRTELIFKDSEDQTCVNSLFPHFGLTPCWYMSRHKEKWINV
jgi:hypothetical protein